jgi:hypothetical protein
MMARLKTILILNEVHEFVSGEADDVRKERRTVTCVTAVIRTPTSAASRLSCRLTRT